MDKAEMMAQMRAHNLKSRAPADKPAVVGEPSSTSSLDRSSDQVRKFAQPAQLHGWISKNKQSNGEGVMKPLACDSQGRLIIMHNHIQMECIGQATLSNSDTFICQGSFPVQDLLIWINNTTGAQVNLTLNFRRQAAATAAGNALCTAAPIVPNYFGPLPGMLMGMFGMTGKANGSGGDIISGLGSTASAFVVHIFGRRTQG